MGDRLIMSKKELARKTILDEVKKGRLSLNEASKCLKISYRQIKRIWRRYKEYQEEGLIHRSRGRKPSNAYSAAFKGQILELYRTKYLEFGPTFAAEKMFNDDNHDVHSETLRLWLKAEGLWHRKRKRSIYREHRERRPGFGDLLQIDGSIHEWFEGTNEKHCLLNIVDDATGVTLALLDTGETTKILLTTFLWWIEKYGIPKAVYVDLKNIYVGPRQLKGEQRCDFISHGFSVFEQICRKLNVEVIKAYSPQAKGRVERKHGVFQDRLVKDLKLYRINSIEKANEYLKNIFLDTINNKFSKAPSGHINSHRDAKAYGDLNEIFCWNYERKLRNDWTVQFNHEYYQVRENKLLKPNDTIVIKKYLNETIKFWHDNQELAYGKLQRKPIPVSSTKKYSKPKTRSQSHRRPSKNHPWKKAFNPEWLRSASKIHKEVTT